MDIKISKELLKNCGTVIAKNKIKQCEKTKPVCLVLEGLLAKAIKKNGQCKEKKQKVKAVKQPSVKQAVKQQSIKKEAPPSYEQVTKYDEELIENYIKATFKKVSIEFKSCDDISKYKEELRKKCIKFLGYDSPAKTPECVKFRFRKFLKENSKLQNSLTKFGCSIDI